MSGARFSVIPAWIVTDARLKGSDLKVLCLLGMHTNREGWCRRSQVKMAKQLGLGRSTVQDSLNRLAEMGAVEKRKVESDDGRDSAHWYRVILDRVVSPDDFAAFEKEDEEEEEFGPVSGAFGLKQYRCGMPPVSKISDGARAAPPLPVLDRHLLTLLLTIKRERARRATKIRKRSYETSSAGIRHGRPISATARMLPNAPSSH